MADAFRILSLTASTALMVLALGSARGRASDEDCKPGFAPAICMNVDITGGDTLKGTTSGNGGAAATCAAWGKGVERAGKVRMMLPLDTTPVGGKDFAVEAIVSGYTGPGIYDQSKLSALGAPFGIVIGGTKWGNEDAKPATFEIKADGTGSLTFEGLRSAGSLPDDAPRISGSIRWRCVEATAQ
jgi:hypothetical protein